MLIALVSDSHGALTRLETLLTTLQDNGVPYLIHAGDFAVYGIVEVLKKFPEINILLALGNCDVNEEILTALKQLPNVQLKEVHKHKIDEIKIAVAHFEKNARTIKNADIFIFGHTHIPKIVRQNTKLFLNPGSLQDDGGYFLLDTKTKQITRKLFTEKLL